MFAVLHLDQFALQAVLRTQSAEGRPVALVDPAARPPAVMACTPEAMAAGVEIGQTAPQALARCESLDIRTPQADATAEAQAALLAAAFSVSPLVEATADGICTLQVGGLPAGKREPALREALARLKTFGLDGTAGMGATPLLALYAARQAAPLLVVDRERDFLSPLPLATADPSPELAAILASWGIRTLGDLTALPKSSLANRLGPAGLALWERAAGETARPLRLVQPPPVFTAAMDCEHAMETLEPLLFILRRFVDRLALELNTAALAAAELNLSLLLVDETCLTRTLRLPEPATQADLLFRTLQTHLETVRTDAAIAGVRLDITPIRASARQQGFFDRALRDPHRFAETLARIAALVGADRVGTPALENTHRPDAFKLLPPAPEIPARAARFVHPPEGLALRRYRPPPPATVELAGMAPAFVWTPHVQGSVVRRAGPWRSAGDWWQSDQSWQREEWDVELDPAGLYRLVRTPAGWFLEGEYD